MKSINKKLVGIVMIVGIAGGLGGCAFDKPEYKTISPSQTAFLIPLTGDTENQGAFQSEELLAKTKVATKEVQIPHVKRKVGFLSNSYVPSATLIVVERKPISREWTPEGDTGTNASNQGIKAETKESIAFTAKMSITAQIDETNATKFLYRYNDTTLEQIMDTEIRTRVQTIFVEQCSKFTLAELVTKKEDIMNQTRDNVTKYFAERGITITQIGLKGDFSYDNADIQTSIDNTFKAQKDLESQRSTNQKNIEKAQADTKAIKEQGDTLEYQLKLKELEVESKKADAQIEMGKNWKPSVIGGSQMFNMPVPTENK